MLLAIYGCHLVEVWSRSEVGRKVRILRMGFSIVENLSGPCGGIFSLLRSPQLRFREKNKNVQIIFKFPYSRTPPVRGRVLVSCGLRFCPSGLEK